MNHNICSDAQTYAIAGFKPETRGQARNQLGTRGGRRVFREGPKFFELCPIFKNYVQHIIPGVAKIFLGGISPPVPSWLRAC